MSKRVTPTSHPQLDWSPHPRGTYYCLELLQSDAYRTLSKIESDLLLFILGRRKYPSRKQKLNKKLGKMNYWNPLNGHEMTIPYSAIKTFFHKPDQMKKSSPSESSITRAIKKLMHVGFLSIVHLGGDGKGNMSIYRLEYNWRVWREGDDPCFIKDGLCRKRGFCQPGSGVFNPSRKALKN